MMLEEKLLNLVEIRVINVDSPLWLESLESFCLKILDRMGKDNWSVSLVLCDNSFIEELNHRYRNISKPTDVLSFSQESVSINENQHIAGDIVISIDYMMKNAAVFETTQEQEMERLITHGLLHLDGMDHEEDAMDGEMLNLQEQILKEYTGELKF